MKILLIHPRLTHGPVIYEDRGTLRARIFSNPEMTLPAVAATIPKHHEIKIIHENIEDIVYSNEYDLVGISCFTMFAPQVYEIADKFRNIGVPVVLGGYHPTALPDEAKIHADSVVIGEAEYVFPLLINDIIKGRLKPFYKAKTLVKGEDIPPLRRDLLPIKYSVDGIRITRGCPHKCEFCSITYFFKHNYCKRPIKNIINELKNLKRKYVYIHDENLTVDIKYGKKLFKAIIKEKLDKKWFANGNIYTLGEDYEFLHLAKQSGCIGWTIGFESIFQKSLNSVKKEKNIVDRYTKWIENIKNNNMVINGLFMFGFDTDTPDVFDKTLEFLDRHQIDLGEFNILTPLPGTPLFDKMDKEGRLLTKDWSKYTQTQVVFKPKNMTSDELYNGTKKVATEFHSTNKMFKRWINQIKPSSSLSSITYMLGMSFAQYIWYKREFGK